MQSAGWGIGNITDPVIKLKVRVGKHLFTARLRHFPLIPLYFQFGFIIVERITRQPDIFLIKGPHCHHAGVVILRNRSDHSFDYLQPLAGVNSNLPEVNDLGKKEGGE